MNVDSDSSTGGIHEQMGWRGPGGPRAAGTTPVPRQLLRTPACRPYALLQHCYNTLPLGPGA